MGITEAINAAAEAHQIDPTELLTYYQTIITDGYGLRAATDPARPNNPAQLVDHALAKAVAAQIEHENRILLVHYIKAFYFDETENFSALRLKILGLPIERRNNIRDQINGTIESGWGGGDAYQVELPQLSLTVNDDFTLYNPIMDNHQDWENYKRLYRERSAALEDFRKQYDSTLIGMDRTATERLEDILIRSTLVDQNLRKPWLLENQSYDFPSITDPTQRARYDNMRRTANAPHSSDPLDFSL